MPSERTVERLSLYRQLLIVQQSEKKGHIYSHQLAVMAGVTPAQVRRDLMVVGYTGSPTKGYDIRELIRGIAKFLDAPEPESVVLVGVGNLGRAILSYFSGRRPNLDIVAAFDSDPQKVDRLVLGCRCMAMNQMEEIITQHRVKTGIISVPASDAQTVADQLVRAGVCGILNFAPVPLWAPEGVFVEHIDMAVALEKVAYFARQRKRNDVLNSSFIER